MEALGILGFVFGLVAFVRVEILTKTLRKRNSRRELQGRVIRSVAAILVVSIVEEKEFAVLVLVLLATTSLTNLGKMK
jgi:hypothetical protein